jgi:hypothetical protein
MTRQRVLSIAVECGKKTCGGCHMWEMQDLGAVCWGFDKRLSKSPGGLWLRDKDCVLSERGEKK